jgi:hypothetical protein
MSPLPTQPACTTRGSPWSVAENAGHRPCFRRCSPQALSERRAFDHYFPLRPIQRGRESPLSLPLLFFLASLLGHHEQFVGL